MITSFSPDRPVAGPETMSDSARTGPWTAEEEALLLTVDDAEFARATGRTVGAANSRRRKLGLPNSYRTFDPEGARATPEAAKALTNCVNALQRVVARAAVGVATRRRSEDPPVILVEDAEAIRAAFFEALRRGMPKISSPRTAAGLKDACEAALGREDAAANMRGTTPTPLRPLRPV